MPEDDFDVDIFSDEFLAEAVEASKQARRETLEAGLSVIFIDDEGRYVEELPDGRKFEVRLDPTLPRDSCCVRLREITGQAA